MNIGDSFSEVIRKTYNFDYSIDYIFIELVHEIASRKYANSKEPQFIIDNYIDNYWRVVPFDYLGHARLRELMLEYESYLTRHKRNDILDSIEFKKYYKMLVDSVTKDGRFIKESIKE